MKLRLLIIRFLLVVSLGIVSYLASVSITGSGVAGCGGASGCNGVLTSKWGYWLNIPVSFIAVANYASLLFLLMSPQKLLGSFLSPRRIWVFASVLAISTLGAAVWFCALQILRLGAICIYCMTAHLLGAIAAGMVLREAAIQLGKSTNSGERNFFRLKSPLTRTILMWSSCALWLLVGGQIAGNKIFYKLKLEGKGDLFSVSESPAARVGTFHASGVQIELAQWPLIGSPEARSFVASFYDYTCVHCREMHPRLIDAQSRMGKRLAFVSLPTPLNSECNPAIKVTPPAHENACLFARIALAIRMLDSEKFQQFDDWMFSSPDVRSQEEVTQYAKKLVGESQLEGALRSPRVSKQIELATKAYEMNSRKFNQRTMPQLLVGRAFVAGTIPTVDRLLEIIQEHLNPPEL